MTIPAMTVAQALSRLYAEFGERAPSYAMFNKAIVEGRVPAFKVGREWRVRPQDWDRVITGLRLRCQMRRSA
jgi:hypothetical protein